RARPASIRRRGWRLLRRCFRRRTEGPRNMAARGVELAGHPAVCRTVADVRGSDGRAASDRRTARQAGVLNFGGHRSKPPTRTATAPGSAGTDPVLLRRSATMRTLWKLRPEGLQNVDRKTGDQGQDRAGRLVDAIHDLQ